MVNPLLTKVLAFVAAVEAEGLWIDEFHFSLDKTFLRWRGYRSGLRQAACDYSTAMLIDETTWPYCIARMREALIYTPAKLP